MEGCQQEFKLYGAIDILDSFLSLIACGHESRHALKSISVLSYLGYVGFYIWVLGMQVCQLISLQMNVL